MDDLKWLQAWFTRHCNGDWEHGHGVRIETLDNPGWSLKISLDETELENVTYDAVEVEHSDRDWFVCRREKSGFAGFGGPDNLVDLIREFRLWATAHEI